MTEVLPHVDPQVIAALIMSAVAEVDMAREMLRRRRDRDQIVLALVEVLAAQACARPTTTSSPTPGPHEARPAATLESTP